MKFSRASMAVSGVAALLLVAGCATPSLGAVAPLPVVGYAESGGTSAAQLSASRAAIGTIGVDGVNVTADGSHVSAVQPDTLALLTRAHAQKQKAELLVGNFDDGLGDFSPAIGDRLLGSTTVITAVVADLRADVVKGRWDGVTVDLESLTASHPAGLTSFVARLKAALGPTKTVSICLMATTGSYADEGYDLKGLAKAADHVVLMAYDQHGPTWTKAGPVGGQPWVAATLARLLEGVPAAKVQLGVAGYGYTWPKKGDGTQLSDAGSRALVKKDHATATWDAKQQEWHATLHDGTVVWWSDARTFALRRAYAAKLHLGGLALWSLGLSDPVPASPAKSL